MKKALTRSRIQGVSFHRNTSSVPNVTKKYMNRPPFVTPSHSPAHGAPQPLSRHHIRILLQDLARQTLHTLMTESVEMTSQWRHASRALDKNVGDTFFDDPRSKQKSDEETQTNEQAETLVQARATFRFWKHRVAILEMIAQAQQPLQWEKRERQKVPFEKMSRQKP